MASCAVASSDSAKNSVVMMPPAVSFGYFKMSATSVESSVRISDRISFARSSGRHTEDVGDVVGSQVFDQPGDIGVQQIRQAPE